MMIIEHHPCALGHSSIVSLAASALLIITSWHQKSFVQLPTQQEPSLRNKMASELEVSSLVALWMEVRIINSLGLYLSHPFVHPTQDFPIR